MDNKWESITREELLKIYVENDVVDAMVAEMFGVTKSQVVSKRRKLGINMYDIMYERNIKGHEKEFLAEAKKRYVLNDMDINVMSRALTLYLFRFGPVEDMHQNKQLSQNDIKTLNKYMNDRIATLIYLLRSEDWERPYDLFNAITKYKPQWDKAEIRLEEIDKITGRG